MFENQEIKGLRQDVDLISEQISRLVEMLDSRHADVIMRLELLEEKIDAGFSKDISRQDIEDIRVNTETVREEVSEIAEAIQEMTATSETNAQ